jgi:hypothetical protein
MAGAVPGLPHWTVWIVLISAVVCYSMATHKTEEHWPVRLLWTTSAALASLGIAAIAVAAFWALLAIRFVVSSPHLAGIRTVVTCLVALTLAFLAGRLRRAELGWLAYAAVGMGALKLLVEDLRFGNAASLVVSLLFYGLILILLPRLLRTGTTRPSPME